MRDIQSLSLLEWHVNKRSALTFIIQAGMGPLLYMLFFLPSLGGLLGAIQYKGEQISYLAFVLPGMLVMNAFLLGQFAGIPVRLEKRTGELELLFSLPLPRWKILLSKTVSMAVRACVANIIIVLIGYTLVINTIRLNPLGLLLAVLCSIIPAIMWAFISIGVALIDIEEGAFTVILNVVSGPLFYASSIFYPLESVPAALQVLARLNPLTYATNLSRELLLANSVPTIDLLLLLCFLAGSAALSIPLFNRSVQ